MNDDLLELVKKFPLEQLELLVDVDISEKIGRLVDLQGRSETDWYAECAIATHGTNIFSDEQARRGLFSLLSEEELADAVRELCGITPHLYAFENNLELINLTWTARSKVVDYVNEKFNLPDSLLPRKKRELRATEEIELFSVLPPLYSHQKEVASQLAENLEPKGKKMLVQMPTGSGKTRTTTQALTEVYGKGTLERDRRCLVWMAHSEELCEQAIESMKRVWSQRASEPSRILRYFGTYEPSSWKIPGSIVVASLQKLHQRIRKEQAQEDSTLLFTKILKHRADAVVFDEAHRASAPTFNFVTDYLTSNGASLIGLSATPGRSAEKIEENKKLARIFDNNLITPKGKDVTARLTQEGVLSKVKRKEVETGIVVEGSETEVDNVRLGYDYAAKILKRLGSNTERNKLIVDLVEQEVRDGRPVLLFCCSVEHAQVLSAAFKLRGTAAECVHGAMNPIERHAAIEGLRSGKIQVLTNFGVLTTGFDAPRIRTVVIARPTNSAVLYGQMVGRALRGPKMGGGDTAWVIDVKDNLNRFGDVSNIYDMFADVWSKN